MRNLVVLLLLGILFTGDSLAESVRAEAAYSLRIATLAPRQSPLGKEYQRIRKEIRERTNGEVTLKMYYGGVAGDEHNVVRKMRVGQLDGALLTATGLGALVPQVLVLQAPGLISSYEQLDRVRKAMAPEFDALFDKAGYELIAWGDAGQIRVFSQKRILEPSDLQRVRPWVWRDSPTMRAFVRAAGANGVLLSLPEVYSALQTGMVDTVFASSIAVLSFQWFSRLKMMGKQSSGIVVGAFVIKKDRMAVLPKAAQDYIRDNAKATEAEFRKVGRQLDAEATAVLGKRLKVVNLWPYFRSWEAVQIRARRSLAGRLYSQSLLSRVQEIVGKP